MFAALRPFFITFFPVPGFQSPLRIVLFGFLRALRTLVPRLRNAAVFVPVRQIGDLIQRVERLADVVADAAGRISRSVGRNTVLSYILAGSIGAVGSIVYLRVIKNPSFSRLFWILFGLSFQDFFTTQRVVVPGFFRESLDSLLNSAQDVDWSNNFLVFLEQFQNFF